MNETIYNRLAGTFVIMGVISTYLHGYAALLVGGTAGVGAVTLYFVNQHLKR